MKIKDYIYDLELKFNTSIFDMYAVRNIDKRILNLEFKAELESMFNPSATNPELAAFLSNVLPDVLNKNEQYCMFVECDGKIATFYSHIKTDFIKKMISLSEKLVNVYFSVSTFNGRRNEENAVSASCIYVDIDSPELAALGFEGILKYFLTELRLTEPMLPNYIALSGHGVHLFYIFDRLIQKANRRELEEKATAFFNGDFSCVTQSHVIRCPGSYNVKRTPVKSELYMVSEQRKPLYIIDELPMKDEEVKKRRKNWQAEITVKRIATRRLNCAKKQAAADDAGIKEAPHPDKSKKEKKSPVSVPRSDSADKYEVNLAFRCDYNRKNNYWNMLLDLHNYVVRHHGVETGKRDLFTHIFASYAYYVLSEADAILWCSSYFDDEFLPEMKTVISNFYRGSKKYRYSCDKICQLLEFEESDINESYINFSPGRRKQAACERAKRYREKFSSAFEKKYRNEYILKHDDMSTKELAELIGVSERTVQRVRFGENKFESKAHKEKK